MTELLETLFLHACENPAGQAKEEKMESIHYGRISEQTREALKQMLNEEEQDLFTKYIHAETQLNILAQKALLRAGLSIGLELSRL